MNAELIRRMADLSEEEKQLLSGHPLTQSTYTQGFVFEVSSEKLLTPR